MKSCTYNPNNKKAACVTDIDLEIFDAPIESIRRSRSLNISLHSKRVSEGLYKILKSYNGRKLFT